MHLISRTVACILLIWTGQAFAQDRLLSLWRIDAGSDTVYLLGSMHAMRGDMYPLPGEIIAAYEDAEAVVFEADISRLAPDEISAIIRDKGTYRPPASIVDDLEEETRNLLIDYLREARISFDQVRYLKPWNLALNIGIIELNRLGYKTEHGLDQYLQRRARQDGKVIIELESFEAQVEVLSRDRIEVQEAGLRETLRTRKDISRELEEMVAAWRTGDPDRMYRLAVRSSMGLGEELAEQQMRRLLVDRNEEMVKKIRTYVGDGRDYLVVVGALHMGGPDGIISRLSDDHEVRQIPRSR